jgi:hypothetical protein
MNNAKEELKMKNAETIPVRQARSTFVSSFPA